MNVNDDCARALCNIGIGVGLVAIGAVGSGTTEILKGSGEFAIGLRGGKPGQLDAIIALHTKAVRKNAKRLLQAELKAGRVGEADIEIALSKLPQALVAARLTAANLVNAHDGPTLAAMALEKLPETSVFRTSDPAAAIFVTLLAGVHAQVQSSEELLPQLEAARFEVVQVQFAEAQTDRDDKHAELLAAIAKNKGVQPDNLKPLFERVGRAVPESDFERHVREAVDEIIEQGAREVQHFNDGHAIEAAIEAAREKLRLADTDGALALLRERREEQEQLAQLQRRGAARLAREEAEVLRSMFDREGAIAAYTLAAELDGDNYSDWGNVGDLQREAGNLPAAEEAFSTARDVADKNGDERDRSVCHDRIGDVQVACGDLAGGEESFRACLKIAETLAARDGSNSEWQRGLSVSHNKIGDVQVARGDLAGAEASYRASMEIREALAARDGSNSQWQRDLSVSHEKIGNVQVARGDLAGAAASYRAGLEIREALAARDGSNSEWQRDLSV
ncbi:MAG: hypothetical protein AAGI03_18220, partial [Pseudomonadota bacterium]